MKKHMWDRGNYSKVTTPTIEICPKKRGISSFSGRCRVTAAISESCLVCAHSCPDAGVAAEAAANKPLGTV